METHKIYKKSKNQCIFEFYEKKDISAVLNVYFKYDKESSIKHAYIIKALLFAHKDWVLSEKIKKKYTTKIKEYYFFNSILTCASFYQGKFEKWQCISI